jgi:hypothetical protein
MIKQGKISHKEFEDLSNPLKLDLIAIFNLLEEDVNKLLSQSIKEHWTPDILIKKIGELI